MPGRHTQCRIRRAGQRVPWALCWCPTWRLRSAQGEGSGDEGGPDRAWRYSIDADPPLDELQSESSCECQYRALCRGVVEEHRSALVGCDGGRVDDAGSLLHMLDGMTGHVKHREDVASEGALQLLGLDLLNALLVELLGGIIDEHIDAAELLHYRVDR